VAAAVAAALVLATIGFFVLRSALRRAPSSGEVATEHAPSTGTPEVAVPPSPTTPPVPDAEHGATEATEAEQHAREQKAAAARQAAERLDAALRLLDRAKLTEQADDFLAARAALSPLAAPLKGSPYEAALTAALARCEHDAQAAAAHRAEATATALLQAARRYQTQQSVRIARLHCQEILDHFGITAAAAQAKTLLAELDRPAPPASAPKSSPAAAPETKAAPEPVPVPPAKTPPPPPEPGKP
jgi:hypothetical protein